LPSTKSKSNQKITNKKIHLFKGPLIIEAIKKKFTNYRRNGAFGNENDKGNHNSNT